MKGRRFGFAFAAALTGIVAAGSVLAQGIALVTDVSGRVSAGVPVTILSEIAPGSQLELQDGARLVALYVRSGDEYAFSGPARVRFQPGGPEMLAGSPPQKRASPLARGGNVTIRPAGVAQAAYVMRSSRPTARIRLLTLSGSKSLDASPQFRWQGSEPGATYRFELTDDTGRALYETEVRGSALTLPASISLKAGSSYTWEVSTRTADNRRFVSAGDFTIATAELHAQAQALRPAASAPVSDRVAYAAWLDQMELRDEARRYWQALAKERPDDDKLRALAGE